MPIRPVGRVRRLVVLAALLCAILVVGPLTVPASAASRPGDVGGVDLQRPRADGIEASIEARWRRAARATSYQVRWRAADGTARKQSTSRTGLVIDGLAQGAPYCVAVRALNGERQGSWSPQVCRTTPRVDPVQPVWVDRQGVGGVTVAMTFRWHETAGATSYELAYAPGEGEVRGGRATRKVTVHATGTATASATVGGLQPATAYCFQVRARGPFGTGPWGAAGCKHTTSLGRTGGPVHLDLMTWNLCTTVCTGERSWERRRAAAVARIEQIGPDAVAVQEAGEAGGDFATMPDYRRACKVGDGAPRQPGLPAGAKNQALLVRASRFAPVAGTASGYRFLPGTHGGCWVVLDDKSSPGRRLVLASVHLINPAAVTYAPGDQVRRDQMTALWNAVAADPSTHVGADVRQPLLPVVFAGDFNSERNRALDGPRVVLNAQGFDDAFDVADRYETLPYVNSFNGWARPGPISLRWGSHLDRVFVPLAARVTGWRLESPLADGVGRLQLSDHSPVRVTIEIP